MKRFRKTAAALSAVFSLSLLSGCGLVVKTDEAIAREEAQTRGIVLAEGDGIKVTLGEVLDEYDVLYKSWEAQYGEENMKNIGAQLEQQKIQIMDRMLQNQIMTKKADELNIPAESEQMEKDFASMVADSEESAGGKKAFDTLLEDNGYTRDTYKAEVMKGLRMENLINEVTKDLTVSDEEIQSYYDEKKASDYTVKPGATIYHIFFGKPDDATAEAKAKEAKTKLDGGADFAAIAKEYGQDSSASSGGLLGTYPWDTEELGADFMAEAKKLSEGQISGPVKTSFGWHIIKVTDIVNEERVKTLDEEVQGDDGTTQPIKEEIRSLLISQKKTERVAQLLDQWELQYNVKRYPERIPMENADQTTQPGTDTATDTPATAGDTTTPETSPSTSAPATTSAGTSAETSTEAPATTSGNN